MEKLLRIEEIKTRGFLPRVCYVSLSANCNEMLMDELTVFYMQRCASSYQPGRGQLNYLWRIIQDRGSDITIYIH
jgi:hypothetical protein